MRVLLLRYLYFPSTNGCKLDWSLQVVIEIRLKETILLWFIVLRRVVMCSTLAKDFSWALSLATGTMHCRKSLLSVSSFNGMTWLLLLVTEKEVMAHELSMCHSYSVREDEQKGQEPQDHTRYSSTVPEQEKQVDLVTVFRLILRSLDSSRVARPGDQATAKD